MERLDIKVSFKCNNRCKFCVQGDKRQRYGDRSADEIRDILRSFSSNYEEVVFTGGESAIRPDIIELVSFAKGAGYKVQIQSNGRMFAYKDFCRRIIDAGADTFSISIHGHNARIHDYLTGARGSFQQSSRGISNLLSLARPAFTNTVITKVNYKFLPEIAKFLVKLGVYQYQFAYPHIVGSALINKNRIVERKSKIMPFVLKGLDVGIRLKKRPRTEAIPYCFLIEYKNCIAESNIPETKVFDTELTESFSRWRKEDGKIKGPRCRECKYFSCCEGPWREYPQIFGWDEFTPVM